MQLHPHYSQNPLSDDIYYMTIPLNVGKAPGVNGVFLVDTGGLHITTALDIGTPDTSSIPRQHMYASGSVMGYPTVGTCRFSTRTYLQDVAITHKIHNWNIAEGIDGILGLLPAEGSVASKLESIGLDFQNWQLSFNQANCHPDSYNSPRIVQTPLQHPAPPLSSNALWIRGSLALLGPHARDGGAPVIKRFKDIWMFLDTGSTLAMTFVEKSSKFSTVKAPHCSTNLGIHTLRLENAGDNKATMELDMPHNISWPSCIPSTEAVDIDFVVLGIQILSKLAYLHYTIDKGRISSVCIGQPPSLL